MWFLRPNQKFQQITRRPPPRPRAARSAGAFDGNQPSEYAIHRMQILRLPWYWFRDSIRTIRSVLALLSPEASASLLLPKEEA
jgi:hypothetical protein